MACAMLGLFTASAFIDNNYVLLILNQIGVLLILWVRLIQPRRTTSKKHYLKLRRIVAPTFMFITTLTCGSLYSDEYKWYILIFAVALLVGLYKFLEGRENT
jgi:hypothetical protein